jgi:DNA-directed RNA polymerase subunit RPC12/RpoP
MSFYEFSASESVEAIRTVSYQCENCGRQYSYLFHARESWSKSEQTATKHVSSNERFDIATRLKKAVHEEAIDRINDTIKGLDEHKDFGFEKCPGCGYIQSWMLRSSIAKYKIKYIRIPSIIVAVLLFVVVSLLLINGKIRQDVESYGIFLVFGLWVIIYLIIRWIGTKIAQKEPNKTFGAVNRKNTPIVTWSEPKVIEEG